MVEVIDTQQRYGGRNGTREALVRELQALRRGDGLTLRKLSRAPTLLGLTHSPGEPIREDEDAIFTADRVLRVELANLGDGLAAQALRAAMAVDRDDPKTLTYRRHDFAEQHGRHPDTIESHENRGINELALRLLARHNTDAAADPPAPSGPVLTVPRHGMGVPRLVRGHEELTDCLRSLVSDAQECLVATGSRSRDPAYLATIEEKVEHSRVVHYRILYGPPHWPVLRSHLLRLDELRSNASVSGDPRILIGLVEDFRRDPECFICASERRAVLILPSLSGLAHYDTGLELEGEEYGIGYVRLVKELYAAARPLETRPEILDVGVIHE